MKKTRFSVLLGLMSVALLATACGGGPSGTRPDDSGELVIIQIDDDGGLRFEPNDVVLTVGQRVRIVLENKGSKDHEFMVGRNVVRTDDGAANGFETDFFEGIEDLIEVTLGDNAMLMIDGDMVGMDMDMGDGDDDEHADDAMDHMGWMVMSPAGSGVTIIEFTVTADMIGEWEMGCFEDDGSHYDDGMKGTLTVVEA